MNVVQNTHSTKFQTNKEVIRESKEYVLFSVPLSKLTSETEIADHGKNRIILKCSNGESCFHNKTERISERKGPITKNTKPYNNSRKNLNVYVVFCNEDTAKKMKKAFNHLINKSGGKQELF